MDQKKAIFKRTPKGKKSDAGAVSRKIRSDKPECFPVGNGGEYARF